MRRQILGLGAVFLALFLAAPWALGASVDMDAPDGIAALHTYEFVMGSSIGTSVSLLGTDGHIYVYNNVLQAKGKWECISVEWPAPLEEIVEWVPGNGGFGPGYIVTKTGERWFCEAQTYKRGYKDPVWIKLYLPVIVESIKPGDRCE